MPRFISEKAEASPPVPRVPPHPGPCMLGRRASKLLEPFEDEGEGNPTRPAGVVQRTLGRDRPLTLASPV